MRRTANIVQENRLLAVEREVGLLRSQIGHALDQLRELRLELQMACEDVDALADASRETRAILRAVKHRREHNGTVQSRLLRTGWRP